MGCAHRTGAPARAAAAREGPAASPGLVSNRMALDSPPVRGPPRGQRVRAGCLPLLQPEILLEGRPPTTLAAGGDMWAAGGWQGCHCPAAGPVGVRAVKPPASPGSHPGPAAGVHLVETAAGTPPPNGHHPAPRGPNHRPWTRRPPPTHRPRPFTVGRPALPHKPRKCPRPSRAAISRVDAALAGVLGHGRP